MSVYGSKLCNIKRMLFMPLIDDSLILSDSSGIMHCVKELIPCFSFISIGLIALINSIMMLLSDLLMSTSLKPGVSMSVIFPVVATLTHDVTAWKFLPLLNSHAILSLAPSNSSANIYAIADKAVDLP